MRSLLKIAGDFIPKFSNKIDVNRLSRQECTRTELLITRLIPESLNFSKFSASGTNSVSIVGMTRPMSLALHKSIMHSTYPEFVAGGTVKALSTIWQAAD